MFRQLLPTLRLQNLTVKHDKAELALAVEDGRLCLDQYKFDLIAILDRLYDRIDGTVVFEDMERLDEPVCVEIMTKLRELNGLINTYRKQQGRGDRPIRFIYVLSDDVFSGQERSKFFDFIMPVVPVANEINAQTEFELLLNSVGLTSDGCERLLELFPPGRKDMRTIRNIVGEYQLLLNICRHNGYGTIAKETLLALTCYKVLHPRELADNLLWGIALEDSAVDPQFELNEAYSPLLYADEQYEHRQLHILKEGTVEEKRNLLANIEGRTSYKFWKSVWKEELLLKETDPKVKEGMKKLLKSFMPRVSWLEEKLKKLEASDSAEAKQILSDTIVLLSPFEEMNIARLCYEMSETKLSRILMKMPEYPRIDVSTLDTEPGILKRVLSGLLSDLSQAERDRTVAKLLDPSVPGNDTEQPDAAGSTPTETPV